MQTIRSILKCGSFTILNFALLVGCATREPISRPADSLCMQACQASYSNALGECSRFVSPISNQSTRDEAEATCLRRLGFPRGSRTCDARCG